jgi:hypothetical protein
MDIRGEAIQLQCEPEVRLRWTNLIAAPDCAPQLKFRRGRVGVRTVHICTSVEQKFSFLKRRSLRTMRLRQEALTRWRQIRSSIGVNCLKYRVS